MQTGEPQMFSEISSSNLPLDLLPEAPEAIPSKTPIPPQLPLPPLSNPFPGMTHVLTSTISSPYQSDSLETLLPHQSSAALNSNVLMHNGASGKDVPYSYCDMNSYKSNSLKCGEGFGVSYSHACLHREEAASSSLPKDVSPSFLGLSPNTPTVPCTSVPSVKTHSKASVCSPQWPTESIAEEKAKRCHSTTRLKKKRKKRGTDAAMKLALQTLHNSRQEASDRSFWFGRYVESEVRLLPETLQTELITQVLKLVQNYKARAGD